MKLACVPSTSEAVAGVNRSFCNISQSRLHNIFFSLPRSQFDRDRCASPTVEWVAGVCLSFLCSDSSGAKEAPLIFWGAADDHSSLLASEAVVSGAPGVSGGRSSGSAPGQGSVEPASLSSTTSGSVKASSSCMETIQRFVKSCGFSRHVAKQTALARKPSSRAGYQSKWLVYRRWCTSEGHSISRPSLPKIADFLFWLRRSKKLSVSAVMGYRSMLSAVFRSVLPEISTSAVLHDLLRSFRVEAPIRSVTPPAWNLLTVLEFLKSPIFEPLRQASLRELTRKTLFLIALASAKRVSELQALSRTVAFSSSAAAVAYVPEFLAKTESALRSLPRSFEREAACKILAGVAGGSFFTNPARSGGTAADAVVSVCASSPLGSSGSRCSGSVVSGDRTRSSVVIESRPPRTGCFPSASVSPARLVVRRLGCRLGSSPRRPGRFRPLVSRGGSQLHQSAGASGNLLCSPAFSASGSQLFLILRLGYLRKCFYALSAPYQNILRGLLVFPTGLAGSLYLCAILLGPCRRTAFRFS